MERGAFSRETTAGTARRRSLPGGGFRHHVAAKRHRPCENGIHEHPLHAALVKAEVDLRGEEDESEEPEDAEDDRDVRQWGLHETGRPDRTEACEDERNEGDDRVDAAEGLCEDADADRPDPREEQENQENAVEQATAYVHGSEREEPEEDHGAVEHVRGGAPAAGAREGARHPVPRKERLFNYKEHGGQRR